MFDRLLNLWPDGPATAGGTNSGTAGPATITGSAKFLGKNKGFTAQVRVGGDITGAGASMTPTFEESANGTSGWTALAAMAAITAEQVGGISTTPVARPAPEIPGSRPATVGFQTTKDYVRVVLTMAGTGPSFPLTSVTVVPNASATLPSGS